MNIEMAVDLIRNLILTALMVSSPILLTTIGVGVFVSIMQSVTSIQEQTLTFVPKLIAVGLVIILASHWLIRTLMEFTVQYFYKISDMSL